MTEQKPMDTSTAGPLVNVGGKQISMGDATAKMDRATLDEVTRATPNLNGQALIEAYAAAHLKRTGKAWDPHG